MVKDKEGNAEILNFKKATLEMIARLKDAEAPSVELIDTAFQEAKELQKRGGEGGSHYHGYAFETCKLAPQSG